MPLGLVGAEVQRESAPPIESDPIVAWKAMTARAAVPSREPIVMPARLVVRRSTHQRNRNRTSPAFGTTSVSPSASAAARSIDSGSR